MATIAYVSSGDRALGKERDELLGGGRERTECARLAQDKGRKGEWNAISLATFAAVRSLRSGVEERVDAAGFVEGARG